MVANAFTRGPSGRELIVTCVIFTVRRCCHLEGDGCEVRAEKIAHQKRRRIEYEDERDRSHDHSEQCCDGSHVTCFRNSLRVTGFRLGRP
jgi:hypothetical protein